MSRLIMNKCSQNTIEIGRCRIDWSVVEQGSDCDWLLGNEIRSLIDCRYSEWPCSNTTDSSESAQPHEERTLTYVG